MERKITKILIANRGEIALRIVRSCKELGLEAVTIYTEKENNYPHALEANEAYCLGSGPLKETYLNETKIIEIAKNSGCDAIHPGYGFLSERSSFASLVEAAGIIFIGPQSKVMELMGDKRASKKKMESLKIPLIPGYHGQEQDITFLQKQASGIGYPILIKAVAGGGGKGMRIVYRENEFSQLCIEAKSEALKSFGDDQVIIEKFIQNPRHIEVQVFSDSHGNHLHLFERECSIQRRYQKIIEESPSPALDEKLRDQMTKVAVKISTAVDYLGAGTIEFILDQDGAFYFLEMNTRLQVEHPITELCTGIDLVKWQILVAEGKPLPLKQKDLMQKGHAIECRIYAEDPDNNFMPSVGTLSCIDISGPVEYRLDCGFAVGNTVEVDFDPMLAKIIVSGENRAEAIFKMILALNYTPFLGVKTNRDFLKRLLNHPQFLAGQTYTHFIQTYQDDLCPKTLNTEILAKIIAAKIFATKRGTFNDENSASKVNSDGPWQRLKGFKLK